MESFLKKIWVILFVFMVFGIMALVPVDKYQKIYLDEFHKQKAKPQQHLDSIFKYVENFETDNEIPNPHIPKNKITRPNPVKIKKDVRKPYYIRDKNNPNILYPYKG